MSEERQQRTLNDILAWADIEPIVRPTHRPLLPAEVCALGQEELVEVGAHTVTHLLLPFHPAALQRDEIRHSKAHLEKLLGRPVTSFAYPFGAIDKKTILLTRQAGFTCACTTSEETVWRHSDLFQLPRFGVENWNAEEFERRLLRWFNR